MRIHFLYGLVTLQILVFQFLSLKFLRSIPDHVFGDTEMPERVKREILSYKRDLSSWSYTIGAGLWGAMTLCAYVLPFTRGVTGLLAITAASILSSGFFAWTYLRARSRAERIVEELPDTGLRIASLERRSLGKYYNLAWEVVPFVVLAATAVFVFWALPRFGQPYPLGFDDQGIPDKWGQGTGRFLALLFVQGLVTFGLLALTLLGLRRPPDFSPKAPIASRDPERAFRRSEESRGRTLRLLMAAKIGLALQLALMLFVKVETALGVDLPGWAEKSPWAATLFLLALFIGYLVRAAAGGREAR